MKQNSVESIFKDALKTFKERNKAYGDNYHQHGKVMMALFLTRFTQNWPSSHLDSIHDMGVYAFILESLDRESEDDSV